MERKMHIQIILPDGSAIGAWVFENETIKDVVDEVTNNWYFSHKKINPEWYDYPVIVGKCSQCGRDAVLKKLKSQNKYVVGCSGYPECICYRPATKEDIKKQKIKDFKIEVHKELIKRINGKEAYRAMKEYEDDFEELYDKNLSVVATATAIIMGY